MLISLSLRLSTLLLAWKAQELQAEFTSPNLLRMNWTVKINRIGLRLAKKRLLQKEKGNYRRFGS